MGYTPPYLEVRKITGGWAIYGPTVTTTDDLTIFPNITDTHGYIKVLGTGGCELDHATGQQIYVRNNGTAYLKFSTSGTDGIIENIVDANQIYLKTTGTGVVKFGTYTAGAATDSTGFITIQDAGGTVRKLMVQA